MKKNYTLLVLLLVSTSISCLAQKEKPSVVNNMYNIQTGLGLWVNNETRLSDEIALRTEVGFNGAYEYDNGTSNFALVPGLSLEPRWYFNLKKRQEKGKDIAFNAGNYWSLKAFLLSDSFIIANNDNLELGRDRLHFTANWGLKKNLSENWNYEFGIGLGANLLYKENAAFYENESPIVGSLTLRIGFKL